VLELRVEATDSDSTGDGVVSFKNTVKTVVENADLQQVIGNISSIRLTSLSAPMTSPEGTKYILFTLECRP
jgi:hypothetical protein